MKHSRQLKFTYFLLALLSFSSTSVSAHTVSPRALRKQKKLHASEKKSFIKILAQNPFQTHVDILDTSIESVNNPATEDMAISSLTPEGIINNQIEADQRVSKETSLDNQNQAVVMPVPVKNKVLSPFEEIQAIDTKNSESENNAVQNEAIFAPPAAPDSIELQFENADLSNFLKQIEDIFDVKFISDEILDPAPKDAKVIKGNKISFKTHAPLSREQAWNLFVSIMQMANFAVIPHHIKNVYKIVTVDRAQRSALPAFIGVNFQDLPETDDIIRFVYFTENADLATLQPIIESLKSPSSELVILKTHKAFILTDKAYNIKMLMKIIKELDAVSTPESMSILKLRSADAKEVASLYQSLLPEDNQKGRLFAKKQPTSLYFPENTRIIAEPRTNALILLGAHDAIEKIEEFIKKHIDVEVDQSYSPLFIYQLKFADAETVANIMNEITKFGETTDAGKAGGIRGIDQYIRPMTFVAETVTNRLIIKAYHDDYLKAKKIIEQLDEPQPQVAIEVLILSVIADDRKSFGAQIRSKEPGTNGLLGSNIKFQTSGLFGTSGIVENKDETGMPVSGVERILGNLLSLVTNASSGTTVLSLGKDSFGVWGIFQALKSVTNAEIVSNPFLLATNKAPAEVLLGEERRVATATIKGSTDTTSFGDDQAVLKVNVTPQINSDGMIILDLEINIDSFVNQDRDDGTKQTKKIVTTATLSDQEVLALGGFVQDRIVTSMSKTPILGNVPILGWFFKNKSKRLNKENLLILISPRIVASGDNLDAREYTKKHIDDYHGTIDKMHEIADNKDPIHKMFFDNESSRDRMVESFIFDRQKPTRKEKFAQRRRGKKNQRTPVSEQESYVVAQVDTPVDQNIFEQKETVIPSLSKISDSKLHAAIERKKSNQLLISDIFDSARKGEKL